MKTSEILFLRVRDLWEEAAQKPFVTKMADGTLDAERYRNYMLQDYLYLQDYIDILKRMPTLAEEASPAASARPGIPNNEAGKKNGISTVDFLHHTITETENETERVHLPAMKQIGITESDIQSCRKAAVITEYVNYMQRILSEDGLTAGLTALLQCSWVYAYIAERVSEQFASVIGNSPYKGWFDAYTCREYLESNRMWIGILDEKTCNIDANEAERLCRIFETCARYENRFWDVL